MRLKEFVKASGGTVGETLLLPPSVIEVEEGFNPRERTPELEAHIREIADSILADGFDPTQHLIIKYTGDRVVVRDGHCRLEAVRLAVSEGAIVQRVPCDPMPGGGDEVDDSYLVLSTQTKKPLTPLEYAAQIRRLIRQGQTEPEIAARLGKPAAVIRRALDLAGAPVEVREAVAAKQISPTEAVNAVRRNGERAGTVVRAAVDHARAAGRERARPRDVREVTKPRVEPISLCSLAMAVVRTWETGEARALDLAIGALAKHLGPLAKAA